MKTIVGRIALAIAMLSLLPALAGATAIDGQALVTQAQLQVTVTPGISGAGYYTDYQAFVNGHDQAAEIFCVENEPAGMGSLVEYEIWSLSHVLFNIQAAWIAETYWNAADAIKGQAQLAIWDLLDTLGPGFVATGTAGQILGLATVGPLPDVTANWLLAHHDGRQDYLLRKAAVPEPASMLLLGLALVSVATIGRNPFKRE